MADPQPLTVGSLFSGIGGLDLGLERAGMTVRWQSEIDPYASKVLAKHWPHVPNLGDVTKIEWEDVERVDLICGGYPCQPFSYAGARRGHDDPRHLWPYMADALRVLRPRWALLENVPGHLSMGFGDVLSDLAELGYDTEWDCIPAAAVGAPHLRYRVFVVAHTDRDSESGVPVDAVTRSGVVVPDPDGEPLRVRTGSVSRAEGTREGETPERQRVRADVGHARQTLADAAESGLPRRSDLSRIWASQPERCSWWAVEPDVGRVAHGVPHRVDRLRTLGNAVVPQVAQFIGERIMESARG